MQQMLPSLSPHSLHFFTNPFRIHYPKPPKQKKNITEIPHTDMGSHAQTLNKKKSQKP